MRFVPSVILNKYICWLLLVLVSAVSLRAQNAGNAPDPNDQQGISNLLGSIAEGVYKLAWPTATYRKFSINRIELAEHGFDILFTLDGQSGLDQSDLWVQIALPVRDGSFQKFQVRDDNHILVPPFATSTAIASATAELIQQYAAQQQANGATQSAAPVDTPQEVLPDPYPTPHFAPQSVAPQQTPAPTQPAPRPMPPPPVTRQAPAPPISGTIEAEGTCLINSTGHTLTFDYRWGALKWIKYQLAPDQEVKIWWPYRDESGPAPSLAIRYDDDFAPGYTERDYNLLRTPTALPVSCDRVQNYRFIMEGSKIAINTVSQ